MHALTFSSASLIMSYGVKNILYFSLFLIGEIIIQNSRCRHQTTNRMKGLVNLLAAVSFVEIDARIVTKDKNIATALHVAAHMHGLSRVKEREKHG